MRVWQIGKRKYAHTVFSGEGTQKVGGRWTPRGVKAVYTSSSLALAALEILVNLEKEDIGIGFIAISADIPDDLQIDVVTSNQLAENWRDTPASLALIGQQWLKAGRTAVLCVPSAVIPVERNFLLNPQHPDFARIQINESEVFNFDSKVRK